MLRLATTVGAPLASLALLAAAPAPTAAPPDERAIEVALAALDAIEGAWALERYDAADRVRASINLRGASGLGVTANALLDRSGRRWRVDAAGDVGPLTLVVDPRRATLWVPSLEQYAVRPAGDLAPGAAAGTRLTAELAAARARLRAGNTALEYRGREAVGGAESHVLAETIGPGSTATYWIDARTHLPRRVVLTRPGRRDVRVTLAYGAGPRPTRVDATLEGERDVQVAATPAYDGAGRARTVHVVAIVAGGGSYTADVTLDWAYSPAAGAFTLDPPAGAAEVPFGQLVQGVAFQAMGALGSLLPTLMGTR